jgi:hypothetical protein
MINKNNNNKEIKKEIKELTKKLYDLHVPNILNSCDIEKIRHRESDVFEVDVVEEIDERVKKIENEEDGKI